MKNLEVFKAKLKAYFAARALGYNGDAYDSGGCETCGPDIVGFRFETINEIIDKFDPDAIQ